MTPYTSFLIKDDMETQKDSYSLPRTDKCFESLDYTSFLSKLDSSRGYGQSKIEEKRHSWTRFHVPE